ncbi:hypothetical protein [Bartonella tamiae]|uniref:Uncharacterized protein n=1 Tax=Bartonella tamiae Th239 TaxID=1094558 RepID=J0R7D6_9HYPH|nr:hypothetical protein [Bartonella tamiae]EJF91649.1 hypothetical protein ME5_00028 [Bartonella tamiae Th239]EJF92676.1 hypothetical protein MEG_01846 [Bartonella tamiae Th307]
MAYIYYSIPLFNDNGRQISELDGKVEFSVGLDNGEPFAEIDCIYADDFEGFEICYSANSDTPFDLTVFLRAKEYLEQSDAFQNEAINEDGSFVYEGRGSNDPDGYFKRVA